MLPIIPLHRLVHRPLPKGQQDPTTACESFRNCATNKTQYYGTIYPKVCAYLVHACPEHLLLQHHCKVLALKFDWIEALLLCSIRGFELALAHTPSCSVVEHE